mgnify:FL=1
MLNFAQIFYTTIMKLRNAILILSGILFFTSCFKDEPAGAECDITKAYISTETPLEMFFNESDTLVNVLYSSNQIVFNVRKKADLTALAPKFEITKGATIEPASGSVQDFSKGCVIYKVTSEDRKWSRSYEVSFVPETRTVSDTLKFDFEEYKLEDEAQKYYEWINTNEGMPENIWATGNPGYKISMGSAAPDMYPSVPVTEGYEGSAVKLTTLSTGTFGMWANMRLAAGNLFIGEFDVLLAVQDAMQATRFGTRFDKKPIKVIGYYKYKAGEEYQNKDGKIEKDKKDFGTIYSVLYKNHDKEGKPVVLYGDNVQTSPQVVAIAKLSSITDTEDWTEFSIDYTYYEDIDEELLENYGYSFTLVFSSSEMGAYFEGAIGSTLMVDKVGVICSTTEE